jgi:hypothetical protein
VDEVAAFVELGELAFALLAREPQRREALSCRRLCRAIESLSRDAESVGL